MTRQTVNDFICLLYTLHTENISIDKLIKTPRVLKLIVNKYLDIIDHSPEDFRIEYQDFIQSIKQL
jgi:hypothetical protein